MKEFIVLGTCENSEKLAINVVKAANQLGLEYRLLQTDNENEIMSHGVIVTPALIVDGTVTFNGDIPDVDEIKEVIS
jgi:protein-disulfide isomerase